MMLRKYAQGIVFAILLILHFGLPQEYAGFLFHNGEYSYKIVLSSDDSRTWYEAEEICREYEGGHLASVTDEDENAFVNEKIQLLSRSASDSQQVWIGAKDEQKYGKAYRSYQWADGHVFRYEAAFWAPGEPSNGYRNEYDICIALKSSGDLADWIDADCYEPKGYVCKIEGFPKRLIENKRFGYEFDSGRNIYKFVISQQDMLTWPEAEIYCSEMEGGHLVSIKSARESKYIEGRLRMLRYYFGFSKLWIGASDLYNEGSFNWTDGKPVAYQRWVRGEPSGGRRGREEDCAVMTADPHWARWKDEYCLHHLPFICKVKVCKRRADIGFIVDSSASVGSNGFRRSKEFIKNVLRRFKISSEGTHVGLIRFSTKATKIFGFEQYFSQSEVEDAIDKMRYKRGGTSTEKALNMARNDLFLEKPEGTSRPNIPRFVVLLTDGMSLDPKVTVKEAELLKQKGVFITVVAIGRSINRRELINIASSPRNVITVASFAYLKKIVLITKQKVCED